MRVALICKVDLVVLHGSLLDVARRVPLVPKLVNVIPASQVSPCRLVVVGAEAQLSSFVYMILLKRLSVHE